MNTNHNAKTKICLLGATFETGNMGVSALTAGLIESVAHNCPGAEIILLDYGKEQKTYQFKTNNAEMKIQLINMRFSKKIYLRNHIGMLMLIAMILKLIPQKSIKQGIISRNFVLKNICRSDYVASITGGDSFSNIYGLERYLYAVLPMLLVLFLKKKFILLPQTIGPFEGAVARLIARFILNRSSLIYSRDYIGKSTVKELLHRRDEPKNMRFCHDVGFVISPVLPGKMDLDGLFEVNKGNIDVAGINVSGLLYMGGYTKNNMFGLRCDYQELTCELIEFLIKKKSMVVLLVPHVFGRGKNSEGDNIACEKIYAELKSKYQENLFMAKGSYNQNEIKYVIGLCDFFVGSRMHACIAALSQYIPSVGIAYSAKFKGVFDTIGMGNQVADPRTMGIKEIIDKVNHALEDRAIIHKKLKNIIPEVKNEILKIFKDIV